MTSDIIQWNMNGYKPRMRSGEMQRLLRMHRPVCVCLQHIGSIEYPPKGYQLATCSPPHEGHLRTAILVRNDQPYSVLDLDPTPFQTVAILTSLPNLTQVAICSSYNQPSCNYSTRNLSSLISQLPPAYLILGDFNAHSSLWGGTHTDAPGRHIEDLIYSTSMCCLNEGTSTYRSTIHDTFTAIDLSLTSDVVAPQFDWAVLDDCYFSDHFPILLRHTNSTQTTKVPQFNVAKADWNSFRQLTGNICEFDPNRPPCDNFDYFTNFVLSTATATIPMTSPLIHPRQVPWWSKELGELIAFKHRIERLKTKIRVRFKDLQQILPHSSNPSTLLSLIQNAFYLTLLKPFYNKVAAITKRAVIQSKIQSWRTYISSFTCRTPITKIWEKYRSISGIGTRPAMSSLFDRDTHKPILDPSDIANCHARHFTHVSSDASYTEEFLLHKDQAESQTLSFDGGESFTYNVAFTIAELTHALHECSDSTPGPDCIPYALIRQLHENALKFLLLLFNQLWYDHYLPPQWRHAYTVPVPKPGKDPTLSGNYRPIVLTSCLCKLMEKMINPRLMRYIEESGLLSPFQNGSRMGRSTLHSLTHLEHQIRTGFEARHPTIAIFFDIAKAYDTTWRYRILRILWESGMRGPLPKFLAAFLSERSFQVKIGSRLSRSMPLNSGIPQGSVLSGTLFILAINDISNCLPTGVSHSLFVDDFAIYWTSYDVVYACNSMNLNSD